MKKKLSFLNIQNILSRDEMKKIMAGSGGCSSVGTKCTRDSQCGGTNCVCYTPWGSFDCTCVTKWY